LRDRVGDSEGVLGRREQLGAAGVGTEQGLPDQNIGQPVLAAALANLINNLPAVLVLLPLAAPSGAGAILAVLLGVNIGPNLTYTGSLATLLWRRVLHRHGSGASLREFTLLGMLTVPAGLALAVLALWAALHALGG
jgi:arsenical pump membrane protein